MTLFDTIRSAGRGEIVATLAKQAGIERSEAEDALRALLPELGRAIRRTGEGEPGARAVEAAMRDAAYARYLDDPAALGEPGAAADGERVLAQVLDNDHRAQVVSRAAGASGQSEGTIRKLLPLVATLAMAALGQQLRAPSPEISWFGTRQSDHFDAPLLNALAAMFEHDEDDQPPKTR